MGPSDNAKIVFGVAAAAGVVFVSYMFFKIFGTKPEECSSSKRKSKSRKPKSELPASSTVKKSTTQDESEAIAPKDNVSHQDNPDQTQTSFIVIDKTAGGSLPGDDGADGGVLSSKKSDRSSDDSSFDVVEAGGEVEEEDGKIEDESTFIGHSMEESLPADNESSLVFINTDASGIEVTNSTFYHTAAETLSNRKENESVGKDVKQEINVLEGELEETDLSASISSDSEPTVLYSLDGKSQALRAGHSETIGQTKAIGDASLSANKDGYVTADEKKMTSEGHSSADGIESISEGPAPAVITAKDHAKPIPVILTSTDTARTIAVCQNSASTVGKKDIFNLVELLRNNDRTLKSSVLDCVVRVSVFTHNNKYLCEAGCGWVLSQQIQENCSAIVQGDASQQSALEDLSGAVTNLSLSPMFQSQLEGSVSPLIDVLLLESVPESVQMATLRPLTNLSSDTIFHDIYKRTIHQLFALLDTGSNPVRLQCIKVLVNLSINPDMVPYLLSAKAPSTLLDLVDASTSEDLILRTVTMLGNIFATISSAKLSQSSLPTTEKVESPSTLYTALCGVAEMPNLRNKIYRLTRHQDKEIGQQSSKLYHFITEAKK